MWITKIIPALLAVIAFNLPASAHLVEAGLPGAIRGSLLNDSRPTSHAQHHLLREKNRYSSVRHQHLPLMLPSTKPTGKADQLVNLQTILNLIGNGLQVLSLAWAGPCLIWSFMRLSAGAHDGTKRVMISFLGVTGGLSAPVMIGWLAQSCRLAGLFG